MGHHVARKILSEVSSEQTHDVYECKELAANLTAFSTQSDTLGELRADSATTQSSPTRCAPCLGLFAMLSCVYCRSCRVKALGLAGEARGALKLCLVREACLPGHPRKPPFVQTRPEVIV